MALWRVYCTTLQWCHNERDGVSNRQPHDCLLNRLFKCCSKKTSNPRVTGLCAGNSPVTGEFPAQRASNTEFVFHLMTSSNVVGTIGTQEIWHCEECTVQHYSDVIMSAMASQIASLTIVCSTVYSSAVQRKHQIPASLAFVRGIHRWPVNSPHKEPVTRNLFSIWWRHHGYTSRSDDLCQYTGTTPWTHDVIITSLLRQNDVILT